MWRTPVVAALRHLDGAVLRRSRRIVVLSEFTTCLIGEHYPNCLDKVTKLPGGVDLERFRADIPRWASRACVGLPEDKVVFFTCRRLEHRMGLVELIEAVRRLRDEGRDVMLLIAGRGALGRVLARQIEEAKLGEAVRLLGYVAEEKLPSYYRAADCFVLPSRALEGFGLVTPEALASGTPVIGTPVGATPEHLEPLDPRLVAGSATADGLYRAMAHFMDEIASEGGLDERCRAYAEERFSWDHFVDGLERISRELAGQ
jgi:glycosyltransferase involved in cell wall biosynthesis